MQCHRFRPGCQAPEHAHSAVASSGYCGSSVLHSDAANATTARPSSAPVTTQERAFRALATTAAYDTAPPCAEGMQQWLGSVIQGVNCCAQGSEPHAQCSWQSDLQWAWCHQPDRQLCCQLSASQACITTSRRLSAPAVATRHCCVPELLAGCTWHRSCMFSSGFFFVACLPSSNRR